MKKVLVIILLFISNCGYQPVYLNKNLQNFEFKRIVLSGDSYINKKIINTLSIKENNEMVSQNKFSLMSKYEIKEISKDLKGQVELYKNIVSVNLKIENENNEKIQNKSFTEEFTYNSKQNQFELFAYQNSIKDVLIDKIIGDIIIYLNSE